MKKSPLFMFFFFILMTLMTSIFPSCGTNFSSDGGEVMVTQNKSESQAGENEDLQNDDEGDENEESSEEQTSAEEESRRWTIFVYMAADNNLEASAITDFNEMENAELRDDVTILVLLDRSPLYDATNGDWSDTRLYKVTRDYQKNKSLINSQRLDCELLGLKSNEESELDMGNPQSLTAFLSFGRLYYPAEKYSLIIWGHGTGWRGESNDTNVGVNLEYDTYENSSSDHGCDFSSSLMKACAIDATSDSYMSISQLRGSIEAAFEGDKIDLIAFDTCFGLCLEAAYELKDCGDFMCGTPALVPESGWNYMAFLNSFFQSPMECEDFILAAGDEYANSYKNYAYASFAALKLEKIGEAVQSFNDSCKSLSEWINSRARRGSIFSIFENDCLSYCSSSYPTDFYVDFGDLLSRLSFFVDFSEASSLLEDSILYSWSASDFTASLGLFFCVYRSKGIMEVSHPQSYVNGSRETLLSQFVTSCDFYVPTLKNNGSLLDKLFYTNYQ